MDSSTDYNNQFNKLYKARFSMIRPSIKVSDNTQVCKSIFEINKYKEECIIVGTLFIASDLKQTIFDKIKLNAKKAKISSNTYCSSEIKYYLEDETGKIELKFDKLEHLISTGMILGFKGKHVDSIFKVREIIFPEPQVVNPQQYNCKIAFISNLLIDRNNNLVYLKIIFDYLKLKDIETVVIVGSFFTENFEDFKEFINSRKENVVLIPEYKDFECLTFPLLTVHPKIFDTAIKSYQNPSVFNISSLVFGVTSSYIVKDLLKYIPQGLQGIQTEPDNYKMHLDVDKISNVKTENKFENSDNIINGLLALLKVRNLSPNAPDTVPSIPFSENDQFVINTPLNFLFVKDDDFKMAKCQKTGTTVFTIPDFDKRKEIIILDGSLKSLKLDIESL